MTTSRTSTIESRSVEPVPASERHGKPWHLFGLWWTPNMNIVTLITGAIAIQVGLNFTWAVIAIVIGNGLGAIFMASHSAQGPRLGLPQMIQSRAQFGFLGNVLPSLVTIFDGVGYVALGFVVCAQALALLIHTSITVGILISGPCCLALVFVGYRIIHRYQRYLAPIIGAVFVLWTVQLLVAHSGHHAAAHVAAGDVILAISIFASYQLTWAPFVSDYSRYLPESVSGTAVFWYTYLGSFLASTWGMVLGAGAASIAVSSFSANSLGYMISLSPGGALWILALVNFFAQIAPTVIESYTPYLTVVTVIEPFTSLPRLSRSIGRLLLTALVVAVGVVLGIVGNNAGILTSFQNFLTVVLYILAPWTAINLVDFYLIRHGSYSTEAFFELRGGFGLINWRTMLIYLFSFGLEFLFMNSALFVGPIPKLLGGADIAWVVAIIVAGGLYYLTTPDSWFATLTSSRRSTVSSPPGPSVP